jgi:hypothetical protein
VIEFVDIDKQKFAAIVERIAAFSVGIAVNDNTAVGTGTLVASGTKRLVLTAEHVVGDADPAKIRFWCKPPSPLIQKRASEVTQTELTKLTSGRLFPIESVATDPNADLAVLSLDPEFKPPGSSEFYNFSLSHSLAHPSADLEGVSLLCFGFPVANSKEITRSGQHAYSFLGCACHACYYESELNKNLWNRIPSAFSPDSNLILRYRKSEEWFEPQGFSGCGVWVATEAPKDLLWKAEPILAGVVHHHMKKLEVLIASRLSSIGDIITRS